jgi:tetratricopeptide (TPR) repeat protein
MLMKRCLSGFCCAFVIAVGVAAQQSKPTTSQNQLQEARQLLANGSIQDAVSLLRALVETSPDDAEVHLLLGSALALVPLRSESIKELSRAAELQPTAPVLHTLGTALARFGEYDSAIRILQRAVRLNPELAGAHVSLGLLLAERGDYSEAYGHVSKALELDREGPRSGYLHYLKGKLLNDQSEWEQAVEELRRAAELAPDHAETYMQLGLARRATESHAEAADAFVKAVSLAPDDPVIRYHLGLEYLELDKPEQAIVQLKRARRLMPEDRGIVLNLARALRDAGRNSEASGLTKELSRMARAGPSPQELRRASQMNFEAVELEKSGNLEGALAKYREALQVDPDDLVISRNISLLLCRLGRWKEAVTELRAILEKDPGDTQTRKVLYAAIEEMEKNAEAPAPPEP